MKYIKWSIAIVIGASTGFSSDTSLDAVHEPVLSLHRRSIAPSMVANGNADIEFFSNADKSAISGKIN